jgi:hypothetical protein
MIEFICKKCEKLQYSSAKHDDSCTYCDGKVKKTGKPAK